MNNVTLIGNLTRDPEVRTTNTGKSVAQFSVAIKRSYGDATDFIDVEAWNEIAQYASSLTKGTRVFVSGSLTTQSWEDKETGKKRSKTLVSAQIVAATPKQADEKPERPKSEHSKKTTMTEDDIPF